MADGTFHADRLTGIGGSDLAAILGLSKWRSPYQVWLEKTGRSQPQAATLAMRYGIHNEGFVAKEYEAATGRKVERYTKMLRHPEAPLIGHIDRRGPVISKKSAPTAAWSVRRSTASIWAGTPSGAPKGLTRCRHSIWSNARPTWP